MSDEQRATIKRRRRTPVIKATSHANRRLADTAMLEYLDRNHFDDVYKGGDSFFPVRWRLRARRSTRSTGRPRKLRARQSDENGGGTIFPQPPVAFEQNGKRWFDPDVGVIYPDRIHRRPPGTTSGAAGAHTIPARWSAKRPAYQQVFANVFNGNITTPTTRGTPRTVPKWKVYRRQHHQMLQATAPSRLRPRCRTRSRVGAAALVPIGGDGLCATAPPARRCAGR